EKIMLHDRVARFNPAALKIIETLGGDVNTGRCFCPVHDDGRKPSLQVSNGAKCPVVLHCFGGGHDHDKQVIAKLRAMGVWPTSTELTPNRRSNEAEQQRSEKERRAYALRVWNALQRSDQAHFRALLADYLGSRKIKKVPATAAFTLPLIYEGSGISSGIFHSPAMALPVRDQCGKFQGIHCT